MGCFATGALADGEGIAFFNATLIYKTRRDAFNDQDFYKKDLMSVIYELFDVSAIQLTKTIT